MEQQWPSSKDLGAWSTVWSMEEGAACAVGRVCGQELAQCSWSVQFHVSAGRSGSSEDTCGAGRCRSSSVHQGLRQSVQKLVSTAKVASVGVWDSRVGSQCSCVCCGAAVQRCRLFVVQVDLSSSAPGVRMWSGGRVSSCSNNSSSSSSYGRLGRAKVTGVCGGSLDSVALDTASN